VIACEKAHSAKKSPEMKPTASAQPPVHRPAAQPSAPREGVGPSSHAA
jgi:hypothetical protein